ncbi:MAG: cyclodeaminase/cyclohydrolase family protein [Oscillospiraceae bacterium]|nr:cyclodeaminase/cyclohydrolase family protein [Oscillospiraceae bacterium]
MKNIHEELLADFIQQLSSKDPIPGGGGASALIGAVSAALCSMVANLTSGKKKYMEYQADIDEILRFTSISVPKLLDLIEKDAEVFEPLSAAYGIPKDATGRDEILENALVAACSVPIQILTEISVIVDIIESLYVKGSRLLISDVAVAASACRCAIESAIMNVYINTKLMKNRDYATQVNAEAEAIFSDGVRRCDAVYQKISDELRS